MIIETVRADEVVPGDTLVIRTLRAFSGDIRMYKVTQVRFHPEHGVWIATDYRNRDKVDHASGWHRLDDFVEVIRAKKKPEPDNLYIQAIKNIAHCWELFNKADLLFQRDEAQGNLEDAITAALQLTKEN